MKRIFHSTVLVTGLVLASGAAHAACYVEYKAKRDNPLELFYDVAIVGGPCQKKSASKKLQAILAAKGLTLLKVMSVRKK